MTSLPYAPFRAVALVCALAACASQQRQSDADSAAGVAGSMNQLSDAQRQQGWRSLFNGRDLTGWRVYRGQSQPGAWFVKDGVLMKDQATDDIVSVDQFGDFELEFEWKLSAGGNAGVFYRGTEEYEKVYWSAPEYQLLDDAAHPDSKDRLTSAGAAYALYPSPAGNAKPAGEWNAARIVANGAHVEHWLNGTKLLEYELWSPDWEAKIKASKFNEWPNFGKARRGHIAFQGDHEGTLALRNIRIRELGGTR